MGEQAQPYETGKCRSREPGEPSRPPKPDLRAEGIRELGAWCTANLGRRSEVTLGFRNPRSTGSTRHEPERPKNRVCFVI
jgi:hypothetical protein